MTTDTTGPADSESVETSSSGDSSQKASDNGSQSIDQTVRIAELEASNTKLTGDLQSSNGRVQQLRQEREAPVTEGLMAGFGKALAEIAQSQEGGVNEGHASRVQGHIDEALRAVSQQRMAGREQGYKDEIEGLIDKHGLDMTSADVKKAAYLFTNAQTEGDMKDAVGMIKDVAHAKELADRDAQIKKGNEATSKVREETLKESNAFDLNPGAGSSGGGGNTDNRPNSQVISEGLEKAGGLEAWGKQG